MITFTKSGHRLRFHTSEVSVDSLIALLAFLMAIGSQYAAEMSSREVSR